MGSGDEYLAGDIQEAVEVQGLLEEVILGASWRAWVGAHEHDAGLDVAAFAQELCELISRAEGKPHLGDDEGRTERIGELKSGLGAMGGVRLAIYFL